MPLKFTTHIVETATSGLVKDFLTNIHTDEIRVLQAMYDTETVRFLVGYYENKDTYKGTTELIEISLVDLLKYPKETLTNTQRYLAKAWTLVNNNDN